MVAYSFKSRFAAPIENGVKGGTIRAPRKRHAKTGEELQLYTGMRTKACKLIARKTCLGVRWIILDFKAQATKGQIGAIMMGRLSVDEVQDMRVWTAAKHLDAFARYDGFMDWDDMADFWKAEHGHLPRFEGVHIAWAPLPDALFRS